MLSALWYAATGADADVEMSGSPHADVQVSGSPHADAASVPILSRMLAVRGYEPMGSCVRMFACWEQEVAYTAKLQSHSSVTTPRLLHIMHRQAMTYPLSQAPLALCCRWWPRRCCGCEWSPCLLCNSPSPCKRRQGMVMGAGSICSRCSSSSSYLECSVCCLRVQCTWNHPVGWTPYACPVMSTHVL